MYWGTEDRVKNKNYFNLKDKILFKKQYRLNKKLDKYEEKIKSIKEKLNELSVSELNWRKPDKKSRQDFLDKMKGSTKFGKDESN